MRTAKKPSKTTGNHLNIPLPASVPADMRAEFDELINHLATRPGGVVRDEDIGYIENLLFHRHVLRECFENIKANGAVIDGKHNPASILLPAHTGAVVKLATVLGLGPQARARMKLPPTTTSAKQESTPWDGGAANE